MVGSNSVNKTDNVFFSLSGSKAKYQLNLSGDPIFTLQNKCRPVAMLASTDQTNKSVLVVDKQI